MMKMEFIYDKLSVMYVYIDVYICMYIYINELYLDIIYIHICISICS